MRTVRYLLLLLLLSAFVVTGHAADVVAEESEILQTETLKDGLDGEASMLMDGLSPDTAADFGKELWRMVTSVLSDLETPLRSALKLGAKLLSVVILCAAVKGADMGLSKRAVSWAGAAAMTAIYAGSVSGLSGTAEQTVERIADFQKLLLPVLSGALAASGGGTSSAALYAGSTLVFSVLSGLIRRILLPMADIFLLLSAAECAAEGGHFRALRELGGWSISAALKGIVYAFTGYLALTGLLTGSADTMALKAAKTVSGAVPVVGAMLSDASEAILAGAGVLKTSAGIFGMLAVFAIGLTPLGHMAAQYLVLRLITAISGTVGSPAHQKLLENLTAVTGYLLAMTAAALFMALVSICCFLKAVAL